MFLIQGAKLSIPISPSGPIKLKLVPPYYDKLLSLNDIKKLKKNK